MRFIKLTIAVLILCGLPHVSHAQSVKNKAEATPVKAPVKERVYDQKKLNEDKFYGVFRGFVWGLSSTLILEEEKGTFMGEENGSLFYLDYLRGLRSTIGYEFEDNKLDRIKVFIEAHYADKQERLRDLLVVKEDLDRRFGDPILEDFRWRHEKEKNYPESWGWAIDRGELFITTVWQNKETVVTAYIGQTKPGDVEFSVTYERLSTKLKKQKIITKKKSTLF